MAIPLTPSRKNHDSPLAPCLTKFDGAQSNNTLAFHTHSTGACLFPAQVAFLEFLLFFGGHVGHFLLHFLA